MKKIFVILILLAGIIQAQEVTTKTYSPPMTTNFAPIMPLIGYLADSSDYYFVKLDSSGYLYVHCSDTTNLWKLKEIKVNTDSMLANNKEANELLQDIEDKLDSLKTALLNTSYGSVTLIDQLLDDSPTSITGARKIGDKNKVSFILNYDETEVGNSVSGAVTFQVSADSSNWYAYDIIYDHTGSIVSSINYTADGSDVFYLPEIVAFPYIKLTFTGTNTDADDTAQIKIIMCYQGK